MTRSFRTFLVLFAVAAMAAFAIGAPANAEATIESAEVQNGYPRELVFTLTASAPAEITDVTLRYTIVGSGIAAIGKPEPGAFTPGASVTTSVKVDTNPNTNWIPVGNTIEWHWEIATADGVQTVGPSSSFLYMPPDKEWRTVEDDTAIVYYTGPREGLANEMLQAMADTNDTHGRDLLKTELPEGRVTLVVMGSAADIAESQPSKGDTLDNSDAVVTCGYRPGNSKQLIVSTVSCGGSDPVDTVRHEMAHILNASAAEGTLVRLPTWMDEGLAVYAQESPEEYVAVFQSAARGDRLLPYSEMILPVADERQVILQYGQSFAMTAYLIDTYGVPKLNELFDLTKSNTRFDAAFEETYGIDLETFEEEFLAAVGSGGAAPTPRPTQQERPVEPTPQATPAPRQQPEQPTAAAAPNQLSSSGDDSGSLSSTTIVLIGIAIILALGAVMSFLLMMFLQNQRTGHSA